MLGGSIERDDGWPVSTREGSIHRSNNSPTHPPTQTPNPGASTGIGNHAAQALAGRGYTVYCTVRKQADAEALKALGLPNLRPLIMDVSKPVRVVCVCGGGGMCCGGGGAATYLFIKSPYQRQADIEKGAAALLKELAAQKIPLVRQSRRKKTRPGSECTFLC